MGLHVLCDITSADTSACRVQAGAARLLEYASLVPELATAAMLVGLTTTSVLFCSHFHQIEGDIAAGKMSPLVRLGTRGGYEVAIQANHRVPRKDWTRLCNDRRGATSTIHPGKTFPVVCQRTRGGYEVTT